jgi:hypothetical protein
VGPGNILLLFLFITRRLIGGAGTDGGPAGRPGDQPIQGSTRTAGLPLAAILIAVMGCRSSSSTS